MKQLTALLDSETAPSFLKVWGAVGVLVLSALGFGVAAAPASAASGGNLTARGAYLVTALGCADCHTPLKMGAKGPEPDLSR
ncbi:MAG: hypothetical protein U1F42_03275 [Candidatus Competibacteraceae bacterium]